MGKFLNPGNRAFRDVLNSDIYVDKTELLDYINSVIDTTSKFICNSRPRRFGKSITADMMTAYYSRGCNSEELFPDLKIADRLSFRENLNRYDVIHLDVQRCMLDAGSAERTVEYINQHILDELRMEYPSSIPEAVRTAYGAMSCVYAAEGKRFVVIIDEWDVLIRDEANNQAVQDEYINFLRGMFKGTEPTKFIALAYLTGILPIKKLKTQSALNNFDEYTMLAPKAFALYIGFTEYEVNDLCKKYHRDFQDVKNWYDGYKLGVYQVYNPKAVINVMMWGEFQSYWSQTGTYEAILPLINKDFDGLKAAILTMLSGDEIKVKTSSFRNDMVTFRSKDDVLTLLIHLGYLAYDQKMGRAYIPNEEIRQEFLDALDENRWNELIEFENQSSDLLDATLDMDAESVAKGIEKIHIWSLRDMKKRRNRNTVTL